MTTNFESYWLGAAPLPDPKALETEPASNPAVRNDPLIARGWQKTTYIGSVLLLLGVLIIIGVFSRKIEYVIAVGLVLSLILIVSVLVLAL